MAFSSQNTSTVTLAMFYSRVACNMGLEGIVSKRLDRAWRRQNQPLDQGEEPRASGL
jgi:ATP-dependent DNA ligase